MSEQLTRMNIHDIKATIREAEKSCDVLVVEVAQANYVGYFRCWAVNEELGFYITTTYDGRGFCGPIEWHEIVSAKRCDLAPRRVCWECKGADAIKDCNSCQGTGLDPSYYVDKGGQEDEIPQESDAALTESWSDYGDRIVEVLKASAAMDRAIRG